MVVADATGPFSHHRHDLLDLARDRFQFLLDLPGSRPFVADEPALTSHAYVLNDVGFEFSFDWRDYAMTSYVCAIDEDGEPPSAVGSWLAGRVRPRNRADSRARGTRTSSPPRVSTRSLA